MGHSRGKCVCTTYRLHVCIQSRHSHCHAALWRIGQRGSGPVPIRLVINIKRADRQTTPRYLDDVSYNANSIAEDAAPTRPRKAVCQKSELVPAERMGLALDTFADPISSQERRINCGKLMIIKEAPAPSRYVKALAFVSSRHPPEQALALRGCRSMPSLGENLKKAAIAVAS